VSDNSGMDKGLMALIHGVLGTRHSAPPPQFELPKDDLPPLPPATEQPEQTEISPADVVAAQTPDPQPLASYDRRKTADELAAIIMKALQTLDGTPAKGFAVTVYGRNPWNAMLTIKPEAGPVADAGLWRARVREMAVRLRQDYDVADE
jgi:hypothetical protein